MGLAGGGGGARTWRSGTSGGRTLSGRSSGDVEGGGDRSFLHIKHMDGTSGYARLGDPPPPLASDNPRYLSRYFAYLSPQWGTPVVSLITYGMLLAIVSNMESPILLQLSVFLTCVTLVLTYSAFLYLRWSEPDARRPYKVPGGWFGAIAICTPPAACIIILCIVFPLAVWIAGIVWVSLLACLCIGKWWYRRWKLRSRGIPDAPSGVADEDALGTPFFDGAASGGRAFRSHSHGSPSNIPPEAGAHPPALDL